MRSRSLGTCVTGLEKREAGCHQPPPGCLGLSHCARGSRTPKEVPHHHQQSSTAPTLPWGSFPDPNGPTDPRTHLPVSQGPSMVPSPRKLPLCSDWPPEPHTSKCSPTFTGDGRASGPFQPHKCRSHVDSIPRPPTPNAGQRPFPSHASPQNPFPVSARGLSTSP